MLSSLRGGRQSDFYNCPRFLPGGNLWSISRGKGNPKELGFASLLTQKTKIGVWRGSGWKLQRKYLETWTFDLDFCLASCQNQN
uniref:Uncharacterized protein n=1 Tax=Macaca fascicularis TaxID=9541 RepID=A0A7N9CBB4_MACFA